MSSYTVSNGNENYAAQCIQRDQTVEALLDESLKHQEEVTDTLGEQVRRAT